MSREFIDRFRILHDRAKKGALTAAERPEYEQSRRELGRLLLVAQQLNHGGQTLRAALRMAHVLKVEIDLGGEKPEKTSTIDLASGGFAALLPSSQPLNRVVGFTLHLPSFGSGTQPLKGTGKIVSSRAHGGLWRVSFSFQTIEAADRELIEMVIIDAVLARFTRA
jgi:hypothetical protein